MAVFEKMGCSSGLYQGLYRLEFQCVVATSCIYLFFGDMIYVMYLEYSMYMVSYEIPCIICFVLNVTDSGVP